MRKTVDVDLGRFFTDSRPPQNSPMLHFTFSLDRRLKRQSDAGIFPPVSAENSGPHMLTWHHVWDSWSISRSTPSKFSEKSVISKLNSLGVLNIRYTAERSTRSRATFQPPLLSQRFGCEFPQDV